MRRALRFLRYWRNWLTMVMLIGLIGLAAAAPYLAPQEDPENPQIFRRMGKGFDKTPHPPTTESPLGTLPGELDVYFTLVWGLRHALKFGFTVTMTTGLFGVLYGAASGYIGGLANNILMRIADAFLAFPILPAIIFTRQIIGALMQQTGAQLIRGSWFVLEELTDIQRFLLDLDPVMWALIILSWMPYARLVNAGVLRLRATDFVQAAKSLGASHARIIVRHLLPNTISPAIVLAARDIGGMVILQATFAFIQVGGTSPWGEMLGIGRNWIIGPGGNPFVYWWTYLPTILLLILFGVTWSLAGDLLNDWLNPRQLN